MHGIAGLVFALGLWTGALFVSCSAEYPKAPPCGQVFAEKYAEGDAEIRYSFRS